MVRAAYNPNVNYRTPAVSGRRVISTLFVEINARMVELHRHDPSLTALFIARMGRLQEVCPQPYLREIAYCIECDLKPPGPTPLHRRYKISKQAISKAIDEALAKLDNSPDQSDRKLAAGLRKYAQGAIKEFSEPDDPEGMPEIIPVGVCYIQTVAELMAYLRAEAGKIADKHHEDEQSQVARMVRSALGALSGNFLSHTKHKCFGATKEARKVFRDDLEIQIEDIVGLVVYKGENYVKPGSPEFDDEESEDDSQ